MSNEVTSRDGKLSQLMQQLCDYALKKAEHHRGLGHRFRAAFWVHFAAQILRGK